MSRQYFHEAYACSSVHTHSPACDEVPWTLSSLDHFDPRSHGVPDEHGLAKEERLVDIHCALHSCSKHSSDERRVEHAVGDPPERTKGEVGNEDLSKTILDTPLKPRRCGKCLVKVERVVVAAEFAEQSYVLEGEPPGQLRPRIHRGSASELDL